MVNKQHSLIFSKKFVLLALFLGFALVPVFATKAHAIPIDLVNGVSPGSNDSDASIASDNLWHTLLESGHGSVGSIELGMYFDNNATDKTFSINVAGGSSLYCNIRPPSTYAGSPDYATSNPYLFIDGISDGNRDGVVDTNANGNPESKTVSGGAVCGSWDGRQYTIPKELLKKNYQGTTKYGIVVTIRWVKPSDDNYKMPDGTRINVPPGITSELRQETRTSPGLGSNVRFKVNMGSGIVGYVNTGGSNSNPNNSVVHESNAPQGVDDYTNVYYPFGLSCNDTNGQVNAKVTLYDADQYTQSQGAKIFFYVAKVGPNGGVTPLDNSDYERSNGSIVYDDNANGPNGPGYIDNSRPYPVFYPGDFQNNGGSSSVYIANMQPRTHYVLMVRNLGNGQFIYIGLPGDAIFGSPSFDYDTDCAKGKLVCSIPNTTGDIAVGQSEDITVQADASNYGGSPPNQVNMLLKDPPFANKSATVGPVSPTNLNTYKKPWTVGPYNSPGVYTLDATVTDPNDPTITADCPGTFRFTVSAHPYMSVFGGDAAAGVSPELNGLAYTQYTNVAKPGGFTGWNDGVGGSWGSAGAQWSVQALGKITGFSSGRAITAGTPQYLSFTNTPANVSGIVYGGKYDGVGNVKVDYAGDIASAAPGDVYNTDLNGLGGTVPTTPSIKQTMVVKNHDAFIATPLKYGSVNWASPTAIPSYKLIVVGGDIYVGKGVNELDGTYVSIYDASTGKGGNIYTCASGIRAQIDSITSKSTFYTDCSGQLKIFGSLVAKQIHFDRTYGSYGNQTKVYSNTDAAEAIIYGPESWLSSTPGGTSNYSAITGLPPIL